MRNPGLAPELEKPNTENRRLVESLCEKQMSTAPPLLSQETEILVLDIESEAHQAQKMGWSMEQN